MIEMSELCTAKERNAERKSQFSEQQKIPRGTYRTLASNVARRGSFPFAETYDMTMTANHSTLN